MLLVGGGRLHRDRPFGHRCDHVLERVEPAPALPPQAQAAALRDRGAQQRVGQQPPRDDAVGDHGAPGPRFGGSGTKTETSSW